ncbi:hypothetical protein SprV_0200654100 [Sparganum proliferum]
MSRKIPKKFFGYENKAKRNRYRIPYLKDRQGNALSDNSDKANLLSDFFTSVCTEEPDFDERVNPPIVKSNNRISTVDFTTETLNLSALDNRNDFMLKFGTLLSILGNLFDGNISDIPSEECRRLDSLVHLITSESSDRQKRSYNFLPKNVPRSARPIDVATHFLYLCGFNYKIADAKRLSSRSKNPPILVKLFSSIEVDTIFAHRDHTTAYLENAKFVLCHDLTPMERRIGSLFSRKPTASQSNANQLGHNTSGREVSACPTPTTSDSLLPLTPTSPSHSNHLTNLPVPKLAAAAPVVVSYPPDSPTGTHENPSTSARPITPLAQLGAASSTVKSPVAWRQNGETPKLNQTPTQQKGSKIPLRATTTNLRVHPLKVRVTGAKLDIRKFFFSNRVIKAWNALPTDVVMSTSVEAFKRKLDQYTTTRHNVT